MKPKSPIQSFCLSLLFLAGTAAIHAAQFGDFTYESSGTEIIIMWYTGPGGDVTIPGTIAGLPVTRIGGTHQTTDMESTGYPFYGCNRVTNVTIPDSVTSIGEWAFRGCSSLTAIEVDLLNPAYSSVDGVLFNKSGTTLIQYPGGKAGTYSIPNRVHSIEQNAFSDCISLTGITIPEGVTSIGRGAFSGCIGLASVVIGNSVSSIEEGAFADCTGLISVTIPNSVTIIGGWAFYNCTSLTSMVIPDGVTSIGKSAFRWCASLASVTIGRGINVIEGGMFADCTSLTNVVIPDSVTRLDDYACSGKNCYEKLGAFTGCTSLTSITIPESVTYIGELAFHGCTSLTSITLPDSVSSIGGLTLA